MSNSETGYINAVGSDLSLVPGCANWLACKYVCKNHGDICRESQKGDHGQAVSEPLPVECENPSVEK